jgi:hypothetical protein
MPNKIKRTNKKKKKKEKKVIVPYTKEQREKKINSIKGKLIQVGLLNYDEDMIKVQDKMDKFVESGEEYNDSVKLMGTKRILQINLKNNVAKDCTLILKYDENV